VTRPVLVTCGATRNPLDAIRYISAGATGLTGLHLARELRGAGRDVHVLASVEASLRAPAAGAEVYGSTRDLMARMERWCRANSGGVVIHSAAVGDYERLDAASAGKIASGAGELVLRLTPTPKILDQVRGWAPGAFLVSFKAARPGVTTIELEEIARAQALRTSSDLVFANALDHTGSDVLLVTPTSTRAFPLRADAVQALLAALP
jgi:phosphopantothenoylcysteine decarboxylase/phosphopantothenate--cysteine ligase